MSEIIKSRKCTGAPTAARVAHVQHALGPFQMETASPKGILRAIDLTHPMVETKASCSVLPQEDLKRRLDAEYRRGLEEGRATAARSAQEACEHQLDADRQQMARIEAAIREQLAELQERVAREAYHFALAVAERIIRKEIVVNPEIVIRVVQEALRRVAGVESVKLRLSPQDEAFVRERRSDLLSAADTVRDLVIESDEKIERGGCILETASGTVDARTSTQLEQIDAALFGEALS